ncbi:MAG TPA: hypothetical protein PKA38_03735 [Candidatus Levybacteria bacterium]|nr:hypothetical protein [Candidatus Levybacteria bacterium]
MGFESGAERFSRNYIGKEKNIRSLYLERTTRIDESSSMSYLAGRFMEASREGFLRADALFQENSEVSSHDKVKKLSEFNPIDYTALFLCSTVIEADAYRQTGMFSINSLLKRFNQSISSTTMPTFNLVQENIFTKPGRDEHEHFKDEWKKDPTYTSILLYFDDLPKELRDFLGTQADLKECMQNVALIFWRPLVQGYLELEKQENKKKEYAQFVPTTEEDLVRVGFSEEFIARLIKMKEDYKKADI